jgi:hypothetical protein
MAHHNTTPSAIRLEEALTVLFCPIDDAYRLLNFDAYSSLKRLADSEVSPSSSSSGEPRANDPFPEMPRGSSRTCSRADRRDTSRNCGHEILATDI